MTKIAVIIPAYNAADTILACLDSVYRQHRAADEIIVVDDGSSDDTHSLVLACNYKVKLLHQKNQGSSKARQTGSDATKCDFIAYLDADDWWLDDHLSKVENVLNTKKVDFLFSDLRRGKRNSPESQYSERNSIFYPWFKDRYLSKSLIVADFDNLYKFSRHQALDFLLKGFPIYPSTMVVSKNASQTIGGWDIRFKRSQDFDFSLRIAQRYEIFYFDEVHTILGLHQVNSDVGAYVAMQTLGDIKVLKTHLRESNENSVYSKSLKYAISLKLYSLGKRYAKNNDHKNAIDTFIKSAGFPGNRIKSLIWLAMSSLSILMKSGKPWIQ